MCKIAFSSAEQVNLTKYSPVCVKPDDQSKGASSGQVIGEQLILRLGSK